MDVGTPSLFKVRFQDLTAATMKMTGFCDIAPCSLLDDHPDNGGSTPF
jgi:hypothetical protein